MNTIWNKIDLAKINLLLKKANLKIDDDNYLILIRNKNLSNNIYSNFSNEFENILNINDEKEIFNTLNLTKNIKVDLDNPLHLGLIVNLSKIDTTDKTQIFEIAMQLIAQYERIISTIAKDSIKEIKDSESLKRKIIELRSAKSDNKTTEIESKTKKIMDTIFGYTNGTLDSPYLKTIIEKYNNELITERIINDLLVNLRTMCVIETCVKEKDYREYVRTNHARHQRYKKHTRNSNPFINRQS